jgi:HlyD family secretion protein
MKRAIFIIVAIIVIGVVVTLWWRGRANGKSGPMQLPMAKVERGTVALTVSADGTLQPLTTVSVKSYAGGTVDVLAVDVGDEVKPGDLIAKIDPTDSLTAYEQAVADLAAANARLRQAQEGAAAQPALTTAGINQAQASYNSAVKDQERMEKATHPQARAQARAALDKAQANVDLAEKDLKRTIDLQKKGFVPPSDVDAAQNRRDLAKAELESTQERWDTIDQDQQSELESTKARIEQAKASLERAKVDAVQDRLKEADVASANAQVARAAATLNNTKTMLEYTTIRAPRAGVILQKLVEQGTIITSGRSSVAQGTDIVLLGDLTKMFVEVSLDESDVAKVRIHQHVGIEVEAFPNRKFEGVVTRVNPQAVTEQNITTVLVTVEIENPGASLKPGMTATCDFLVEKADNVLFLPSRAVRGMGDRHLVTVMKNGQPTEIPVRVGLIGDERTEIREGLKEGAEVVLPGPGGSEMDPAQWMRQRGREAGGGGFMRRGS